GQVIRCFAVPRGLAILAGGDAGPRDKKLTFVATPESDAYGLCENKYLLERARATSFTSIFSLNDDGTVSYTSDLVLTLAATGDEMHHTDRNTLHRVKRYHPSTEGA
ncbi:MAG TPA: FABP family protein, partial [Candidatus Nanopelagicales bacterium]